MRKEESLQLSVCNYLRLQYPNVIFTSDLSSGMKLSIGQATKAKKMRSSRGLPDLMIFEPNGTYNGLFLELKKEGVTIYKKNGNLRADKHLEEQQIILNRLIIKGYKARFAIGFDEAKKIIDEYLKMKLPTNNASIH